MFLCRMVKFIVTKLRDGCRCRLGELVVSERDIRGNLQTPMCLLYTRGGEFHTAMSVCDQLSGKPGNVTEFCSCQRNVGKLDFCQGVSGKNGKLLFLMNRPVLIGGILYHY